MPPEGRRKFWDQFFDGNFKTLKKHCVSVLIGISQFVIINYIDFTTKLAMILSYNLVLCFVDFFSDNKSLGFWVLLNFPSQSRVGLEGCVSADLGSKTTRGSECSCRDSNTLCSEFADFFVTKSCFSRSRVSRSNSFFSSTRGCSFKGRAHFRCQPLRKTRNFDSQLCFSAVKRSRNVFKMVGNYFLGLGTAKTFILWRLE